MIWQPNRRQLMALGGAAASSTLLPKIASAQDQSVEQIKIGAVFPSRSGLSQVRTSLYEYVGAGGRQGSLLAGERVGDLASQNGTELIVLQASAPTADAARRAGERLVEADQVNMLMGGAGDGQYEVLAEIADRAGIPFFNCGTSDDVARSNVCTPFAFHMEASDAMYLDAMIDWSASQGARRWFVVHYDDPRGHHMASRAVSAAAKHGQGGEIVGAAATFVEQPVYFNEFDQARRANADAILVLLSAVDQIAFFAMMETDRVEMPGYAFPTSVAQTRDYVAALRLSAPNTNPDHRLQLWETTLAENPAAEDFNTRYTSRYSQVADPTAWSAYFAVKIYYEAVAAVGSTDGEAIVSYLESAEASFDVAKGTDLSFRPWDHQLRQPIYVVNVDQEATWIPSQLYTRIGIAEYETSLPRIEGTPTDEQLDSYGDDAESARCSV